MSWWSWPWEIAALQAQLRNREQENEVLAKEIERLYALPNGAAALKALQPRNVQERAWRCMILYGFTAEATATFWRTCQVIDTVQYVGQGSEYVGGLVRLIPGQDQDGRVLHEMTHAEVDKLGMRGNWALFKAAFQRLVNGDGTPEMVALARQMWYHPSQPTDPYGDEHLYVYPITNGYPNAPEEEGLMGRVNRLPAYLWPFYEPIFTGNPL